MKCGVFRPLPLLAGSLALMFAGCAGYQLGPTGGRTAGAKSIRVAVFDNETPKPRVSQSLDLNLRRELQQDGTYRLESGRTADIVVDGKITEYDRDQLAFQPEDVRTVRDYAVRVVAEVTAIESGSGRTNLHQTVEGEASLRVGADLVSAERELLPLVTRDLARNIKTLLVEGSW